MKVTIVDYGAGNTQSVIFALQRIGVNAILTGDLEEIITSDKIILPGVGHATTAMHNLQKSGFDQLIHKLKQPTLGICLGMQLMCNSTEEGAVKGAGIFDTNVMLLPQNVNVPHMGWNQIRGLQSSLFNAIVENSHLYFVHSYYAELCNDTIATARYEVNFSAALKKNNFYGCQFHPEKSGEIGSQILQNFIAL